MFVLHPFATVMLRRVDALHLSAAPDTRGGHDGAGVISVPRFLSWARGSLHYVASHTGLPIVLVAAIALVVSWTFVRKTARFLVEVALVLALLLIATGLGWISW